MTATATDTVIVYTAKRDDAIDIALRRWRGWGWRVVTPRNEIKADLTGPIREPAWRVTAMVELAVRKRE